MHDAHSSAVVTGIGIRRWMAALEGDPTVQATGSWPEQALRNLMRKLGRPARGAEPLECVRVVYPSDLAQRLARCRERRESGSSETAERELAEVAEQLTIFGVKQAMAADELGISKARLRRLIAPMHGALARHRQARARAGRAVDECEAAP
jgi:hypothetical protein